MTPNCTMRRTRDVTQRNYIIRPRTFQDATRIHTRYCVISLLCMRRYGLRLTQRGYFRGYDIRTDATLSNSAASAGLSFVAALTPKTLDLVDSRSALKSGERTLLSAFYAPQEFYEAGAIDRLIVGATGQLELLDVVGTPAIRYFCKTRGKFIA